MSEFERLTMPSEVFDGASLKAFGESCGESDCREFCGSEDENPQCGICPVQKAFNRLAAYEDIGSPEEFARFFKDKEEELSLFEVGVRDVGKELQRAMKVNPLFTSPHHGYAVILEELDELWDEVKKREPGVKNMRAEAVQVAAMAMKFIMSMENDWKSTPQAEWREEKIRQNEAKCLQCKYIILTDEQLAEMMEDPCNTCRDLSNWKPKEDQP